MASAGSAGGHPLGLVLTGELRGGKIEEGRARESGEGRWPDRYIVSLIADEDPYRVEYRDEAAARAAVGQDAQVGDVVSLPVSVRAARSFVFYVGKGAGAVADGSDLTW